MAFFKAKGIKKFEKYLEDLEKRLGDFEKGLEVIASDLEQIVDEAFANEIGPDGPWEPLSDVTITLHPERQGGQILSSTGLLKRSIKSRVRKLEAVIGTNNKYAKAHQFGNPKNKLFGKARAPIPARPFLPIDKHGNVKLGPKVIDRFITILGEYLVEGKKKR